MHVNVDAMVDELEPPRVTLGGVEHVGRHVSLDEWVILESRLEAWRAGKDPLAFRRVLVELTDAMFPPPEGPPESRRWWQRRRWLPWWYVEPPPLPPSVSDELLERPIAVQIQVLQGFMDSQNRALALPTLGAE